MRKAELINVLPHRKNCKDKKCSFALCIREIDKEAICDFQFESIFRYLLYCEVGKF